VLVLAVDAPPPPQALNTMTVPNIPNGGSHRRNPIRRKPLASRPPMTTLLATLVSHLVNPREEHGINHAL
jgi:hypothetical protein